MNSLNLKDLQETIDKEVINKLPLGKYEGPIHLIDNYKSCNIAIKSLRQESILGFDTESRPAFKKGDTFLPSLIQLGAAKAVYLFQIDKINKLDPLLNLLSNPKILKTGIAIKEDVRRLNQLHPFEAKGFVEVGKIAKQLGMKYAGLRTLAAITMGIRISKKAQLSNWAQSVLTPSQISYAATDAWISRELYLLLNNVLQAHPELSQKGHKLKAA